MIFYRVPSIEPSYRINGVDLYTLSELQNNAAEMQQLQIERLTKQREWQGLTMEEVQEILTDPRYQIKPLIVHAVEAKLKEKNT